MPYPNYPDNPLQALGTAGAFEIGGGDFKFGQDLTPEGIASLFKIPVPTLENAVDLLQEYLLKLPIEALKAFQDLIPGAVDEDFVDALTAVSTIIDALQDSPIFITLNELTQKIAEIVGVFTGLAGVEATLENLGRFFDGLQAFDLSDPSAESATKFVQQIIDLIVESITGAFLGAPGTLEELTEKLPLVSDLAHYLMDTTPEDGVAADLPAIGAWAKNLLNADSDLPAEKLKGTISAGVFSTLPVSHINLTNPNLLSQGSFGNAETITGSDGWSWDGNESHSVNPGSAKVSCNGTFRNLYSTQTIQVVEGDKLELAGWIKTSGFSGSGTPIQLSLIPFNGTNAQPAVLIASGGESSSWTEIKGSEPWAVPSGVTSVRVRLTVTNAATAGSVWFDDIWLNKAGLMGQSLVEFLTDAWNEIWRGAFNLPPGTPVTGKTVFDMFTALLNPTTLATTAQTAVDTVETVLKTDPGSILGILEMAGQAAVGITTAIVDGIGNTIRNFLDFIVHAFDRKPVTKVSYVHPTTGQIVRTGTPVSLSPLQASVNDLALLAYNVTETTYDTSFATNTQSEFWNTPRVVPAWVGLQSDDVAFAQSLIDGNESPDSGRLILIPVKASQDRTYDAVKFAMNVNSSTGFTMTSCLAGVYDVDETTGQVTKVLELGSGGDIKKFLISDFNVQSIPIGTVTGGATVSASTTPLVNGKGTSTIVLTSAPDLAVGDMITVGGLVSNNVNNTREYVGTFKVTAVSTTAPFSVSFESSATGTQSVSGLVCKMQPKSVGKGEVFFIGLLQTGATVPLFFWSRAGDITTGLYPRYIGSYCSSLGIGALPATMTREQVLSGRKYWGALGTMTPYVTQGTKYYSDTFSRNVNEGLGQSWTTKYGVNMVISTSGDLSPYPATTTWTWYTYSSPGGGGGGGGSIG